MVLANPMKSFAYNTSLTRLSDIVSDEMAALMNDFAEKEHVCASRIRWPSKLPATRQVQMAKKMVLDDTCIATSMTERLIHLSESICMSVEERLNFQDAFLRGMMVF